MPKIVDIAAQKRQICDAARRVFARRGVRGTGLAQVAEAAGMGRSSLYHYYPDKTALVRDMLKHLLAEEEAFFANAATGAGTPRERLDELAAVLPWAFREWAAVGRLLVELRASDAARFRPFFRRIRAALTSLLAEGQRVGDFDKRLDPAVVSATVIGAIDGILLQFLVEPAAFPDQGALCEGVAATLRKLVEP